MNKIDWRARGLAVLSRRTWTFFGCALVCAAVLMGLFINTLQLSIERGKSLREIQPRNAVANGSGGSALPAKPMLAKK